jgi:hypothetical protein
MGNYSTVSGAIDAELQLDADRKPEQLCLRVIGSLEAISKPVNDC